MLRSHLYSRINFPNSGRHDSQPMSSDGKPIFEDMRLFAELWERELPGVDPSVFQMIGSLLRLAAMLENEFRAFTQEKFDMGTGDMRILLALRRAGRPFALRPTDLFQSLLITSGAVTKQVERLTRRGLVDRIPDPNRKAGRLIHLTKFGKKVTDQTVDAIHSRFNITLAFRGLTEEERQAGNLFLRKMIVNFDAAEYHRATSVLGSREESQS